MSVQTAQLPDAARQEAALLSLVSAAHFISHVHIMVLPALIPLLPSYFGVSFLECGFALTVFNLVSLAVQTPMGFVTDRIGAGTMLIAGLIVGGVSFLALSFAPVYTVLLLAMAGAGIANGVYHPADYALLSAIDVKKLGRAYAIHTFSGLLGTAVTPLSLLLLAQAFGIATAFAVAGGAALAVAALLVGTGSVLRHAHVKAQEAVVRPVRISEVVTVRVVLLTMMFALLSLSAGGIQAFGVPALQRGYGVDLAAAGSALTAFLFASAFGVLAGGFLADRSSNHGASAAATMAIAAVLTLLVTLVPLHVVLLIVVLGAAGFFSGVITPSRDLLVRSAAPPGAEGRVFGIVSTGFNIGGAIGPIIFASLVDGGHYHSVFGLTALFMVMTAAVTLLPVFNRR